MLRQQGHLGPAGVHLAIFEAKGVVSVLPHPPGHDTRPEP
ncbi:hypothetical protein ACOZ38_16595 [Sphaerisporangium viridialbum]